MPMSNSTSPPQTALLLTNLGTPKAPTRAEVRRYLAEFLSDPLVVQVPRPIWLPLLHGVILPLRSGKVARKYAHIWHPDGSPLAVYMRQLAAAVQALMPEVTVRDAMRYGQPSLRARLDEVAQAGVRRVLVLPVYPQYSTTTTGSVEALVARRAPRGITASVVRDYADDPGWVEAVAASIRAHWREYGRGRKLLMSFHGIPQRLADAGDPYPQRCQASARAIAAALGLGNDEWQLSYQSRFGRERWLGPATIDMLREMGAAGVDTLDVICPGFAVDCLETLEEIAIANAAVFRAAGGQHLSYIPCLNASPAHAEALVALARRELEQE